MRVKIVSSGRRADTKIVDADTGEPLDDLHVYGISWTVPVGGGEPECILTCRLTEVDIEAEVQRVDTVDPLRTEA